MWKRLTKQLKCKKGFFAALLPAAASVVGGLIAAKGQKDTNKSNAEQAEINRDFQQSNSDTAHQREVKDLREAGINPILSAKFGGASTPSGAMATMNNPMEPIANGINSASNLALQTQMTRENIMTQRSVQNLNSAQAVQSKAAAIKTMLDAQKVKEEIPAVRSESEKESAGEWYRKSDVYKWIIKPTGDTLKELNPFKFK